MDPYLQDLPPIKLGYLKQRADALAAKIKSERLPPIPPYKPPHLHHNMSQADPADPLVTDQQMHMNGRFELGGVVSLTKIIYQHAHLRNQVKPSDTWDVLREDMKRVDEHELPEMLATIPTDVIRSLIRGDMPSRYFRGGDFKKLVDKVELRTTPGIYVNIVYRKVFAEHPTDKHGASLTLEELQNVYDKIELYLDHSDSDSAPYAVKVDTAFQTYTANQVVDQRRGQRRYAKGKQVVEIERWLQAIHTIFLNRADMLKGTPQENLLQQPMERCFQEIGWGRNCHGRALEHLTHRGTNCILGLLMAILRVEYAHKGTDAFGLFQRQALFLRTPNQATAKLADTSMTVLASGHWYEGGLNPNYAGGVGKSFGDEEMALGCHTNRQVVRDLGSVRKNLEDSRQKLDDLEALTKSIKKQSLKEGERKALGGEKKVDEALAKYLDKAEKLDVLYASEKLHELLQAMQAMKLQAASKDVP